MPRSSLRTRVLIIITFVLLFGTLGNSLPLTTRGPWITDTVTGARIKLQCVTWIAHMQTFLPEGLDRKPLNDILLEVSLLGFNCVRLTWATYMFIKPSYNGLVRESFQNLNLPPDGLLKNNPYFLNLTLVQAFDTVVRELGKRGFLVVLDNHVPEFYGLADDGNVYNHWDFDEWLNGTIAVAKRYNGMRQVVGQVVGMTLRNELQGSPHNVPNWYTYVRAGATKVHEFNPDVLIIVSGLNSSSDLSFLKQEDLKLGLNNKLVYEVRWFTTTWHDDKYAVWDQGWERRPSQRCAQATKSFDENVGFVAQGLKQVPLLVSEIAVNQSGQDISSNRFLSCFLAFAAERDLDWGIFALQGAYYLKEGKTGQIEPFGILDSNMDKPQNPRIVERLLFIQGSTQGPDANMSTARLMYHPLTGNCTQLSDLNDNIEASSCQTGNLWSYTGGTSPIYINQTTKCFKAVGDGLPVILTSDCSTSLSTWTVLPGTTLQLATVDEQGKQLCLEYNPANSSLIFTRKCLCMGPEDCAEDPQIQWFSFLQIDLKTS